ncbi:unnamed protein product [Rhodiola kirilowii]
MLLNYIMEAELYDVATSIVRCFPQLIDESHIGEHSTIPPLAMLAANPSAFRSMCFWERIMYACIPISWQISYDDYSIGSTKRGEERQLQRSQCPPGTFKYLTSFFQHIRPTKHIRHQAIQLVNRLCSHASRSSLLSWEMFERPFILAAQSGIVEIVEELAETFPNLLWVKNRKGQNIFQVAVSFRHQSVYNLVYRIAKDKRYKIRAPDKYGNNILHMAGKLAPLHRLNNVSGAALKMRSELQWFKEVGKSIQPFQRGALNKSKKTPKELFTKEHEKLVKQGEKWMKSTAHSCTTPAALIATVVFAAAIAVPNSKIGNPAETAFTVFAVADALSLFTSLSSLLMFVSILTSRYTEDEFLYALPLRILTGLLTLLISIASMMVAFSMILYLTFASGKKWILGTVVTAACVPSTLFLVLHYSLLVDMISYWNLPRISGKKGGRPLYTRTSRERNENICF